MTNKEILLNAIVTLAFQWPAVAGIILGFICME